MLKIRLDTLATILFAVIAIGIGIKMALMKKLNEEQNVTLQTILLEKNELTYQNSRLTAEIYMNDIVSSL